MILQLNPPLPVETPQGKALAHFLIDYGVEHHLLWVCFHTNGECWSWRNPDIRAESNPSYNRLTLKNSVKKTVMSAETERLREALKLILNANSLPYAQEIASKALSEQDASPCPTNTIK